jgi:hypothetical protein
MSCWTQQIIKNSVCCPVLLYKTMKDQVVGPFVHIKTMKENLTK